jgi:trk system potassium uptake protein TrkH
MTDRAALSHWLGRPLGRHASTRPPLALAGLYAALMTLGTLGLQADWAGGLGWQDAAFTAVSAVTVTGLSTLPLHDHLTPWGQALLVILMQIGGIGVMTIAVMAFRELSRSGSGGEEATRGELELEPGRDDGPRGSGIRGVAIRVTVIALSIQAAGLALLAPPLIAQEGVWAGLGRAAFLAVAGFCNAGFTPFPDSVTGQPWTVLAPLAALFVIGGLGFTVLEDLRARAAGGDGFSLHTKLLLYGTAALILLGWAGVAVLEWSNPETLGGHPPLTRLGLALFQGLTPRTAGFDAVGAPAYTGWTAWLTGVLMVIGAGATSTGGGIKVTTLVVLMLGIWAVARGRTEIETCGATLHPSAALRVLWLAGLAASLVAGGTLAMLALTEIAWHRLAFEAASAFGTVGLTAGVTREAEAPAQWVLMALMFIGRVGPLTLASLALVHTIGPRDDAKADGPDRNEE